MCLSGLDSVWSVNNFQVQTALSPACVLLAVTVRDSVSLAASGLAARIDLVMGWRDGRINTDIAGMLSPLTPRLNRGMARISRIMERGFSSFS